MKRKRYTEEQIAFVLWQQESGISVAEIVRKMADLRWSNITDYRAEQSIAEW
jgi:hypothetical protein